ncbi:hypothetical protein KKI22_04280 [Patescibacteria group bacterium]|nr:hypothetical protein [Patescibacteria group bacterium]
MLYDKETKKLLISLNIDGVEVAYAEAVAIRQWPPMLHDFERDYGLILHSVNLWLTLVDRNPNTEKSTIWDKTKS